MKPNELAIKQLVSTQGWKEVENIFNQEIINNLLPENFATAGKDVEKIAVECIAREMASKIVNNCLDKIKGIANKTEFIKESYN